MVLSGSSNLLFASRLAEHLGLEKQEAMISRFPNNELSVRVDSHLKGKSIILVQSMYPDPDSRLVETLLLVDALERVEVDRLTIVMPWMGYSLQDRVFQEGEACSAAVVGRVMTSQSMGAFVAVDLHHPEIQEYFRVPVRNVLPDLAISQKLKEIFQSNEDLIIVAPDRGAEERASAVAVHEGFKCIVLDKKRSGLKTSVAGDASQTNGKVAIVIDDIINTGSTCKTVTAHLKEAGASQVWWVATHGLFTGNASENLAQSGLDGLMISDTTEPPQDQLPKTIEIQQFSVAELVAQELKSLNVV